MRTWLLWVVVLAACDCGERSAPAGGDAGLLDAPPADVTPDSGRDAGPRCDDEECNGLDDDCDGAVDEELVRACGTDVGECAAGTETCVDATWECADAVPPGDEACNGLDEDCDGTIDEDLVMNLAGDLRVTNDPEPDDYVAVGWSGTGFGVVWSRGMTAREIWFRGLDPYGAPTTDATRITTGADDIAASIAWNDVAGEYGIVFVRDETEIRFVRVRPDGTIAGGDTIIAPDVSTRSAPWIDWNGSTYAVAWHAWVPEDFDLEVFVAIVDPGGAPGPALRVTTSDGDSRYVNVRWTGSSWGLVWADDRDGTERIWYARVDAAASTIEVPSVSIWAGGGVGRWPNLDLGEGVLGVTWHGGDATDNDVWFTTISFDGVATFDPVRVAPSAGAQEFASVDWTGMQWLVAWQDARAGNADAYFAFVGIDGTVGAEHQLTTDARNSQFVTATWTGAHYGAGWRDDRDGDTEIYFTYAGCP